MNIVDNSYNKVVREICELNWSRLTRADLIATAWAYYYFSIQFRENLKLACKLYPQDEKLKVLEKEECDTRNLSPWPGVAEAEERMDHDEFVRRFLKLSPIDDQKRSSLEQLGQSYLTTCRKIDPTTRAISIASYEDGGLESVFRAFLTAPDWDDPLLAAFAHFLTKHIKFDSDPAKGHGALSRHLTPDDRIVPLWTEFKQLLIASVPRLAT